MPRAKPQLCVVEGVEFAMGSFVESTANSDTKPAAEATYGMVVAMELLELGLKMRAERHRREHPEASEAEVAAVVHAWKVDRPGAPFGDAPGRSVSWPRPARSIEL
jgi:Rv0078B-related antitoxin